MKLEQISEAWGNPSAYNGELQAAIWDRVAEDYHKRTLPEYETNDFLKLITDVVVPDRSTTALDIGCGTGSYSLALAKRIGSAVGVDVSPKMIRLASDTAKELGAANAKFHCINWADADIDALQMRGRFDIVFAHTTPAISDYATFDKMNACARNHCFFRKPTRRSDAVQDAAFELVGIRKSGEAGDRDLLYAFEYLWHKGYCPKLEYKNEVWINTRSIDDMAAWCIDRAKLKKGLARQDELVIRDYLNAIADNGKVQETIRTTLVTLYWQVTNE